jgi:hypothetical protein
MMSARRRKWTSTSAGEPVALVTREENERDTDSGKYIRIRRATGATARWPNWIAICFAMLLLSTDDWIGFVYTTLSIF